MLKNSSSKYKNSPTCRSKLHKSTPYDFIPNLLKSYNSFAWRTAIETICRWVNNQFISGWTCPSTFMLHLVTAGLRAGHCGIFFFSRWQNALKNDARLLLRKAISACGSEGLQGRLWLSLYPCVLFEDLFFTCIDLNAYIPPQRRFL